MKISGNTVLITGGATGIGYALAEAFLKGGSGVLICGRRKEKLLDAQKRLPGLQVRVCDITSGKDRKSLLEDVKRKYGQLNVLINNAGIQRDIDLTKGEEEISAGESEIRVNLEAPVLLTSQFIPFLAGQNAAYIINISSGLGFVPIATMPIYCATKAALHSYTMSLRQQLLKTGIKVIEVIPPAVDSDLNPEGRAKRKMQTTGTGAAEFAAAVIKGLEDDVLEIGYGFTNDLKIASREELDRRFKLMNSR